MLVLFHCVVLSYYTHSFTHARSHTQTRRYIYMHIMQRPCLCSDPEFGFTSDVRTIKKARWRILRF
jgi:hypothetical protein